MGLRSFVAYERVLEGSTSQAHVDTDAHTLLLQAGDDWGSPLGPADPWSLDDVAVVLLPSTL